MLVQAIHARKEEPCTHHQAKIKDNKIVISICKKYTRKIFQRKKNIKTLHAIDNVVSSNFSFSY